MRCDGEWERETFLHNFEFRETIEDKDVTFNGRTQIEDESCQQTMFKLKDKSNMLLCDRTVMLIYENYYAELGVYGN